MKRFPYLVLLAAILLSSCERDLSLNPELVGSWKTPGATYTFRADQTYSIEYNQEPGAPIADSVFGDFIHDNKKSNISFIQEGYKIYLTQEIIKKELNGGTWTYSISGDDLTYESKTQTGVLKRINTTLP